MAHARQGIIDSFVEVEPLDRDGFLKVKETLTRIGLPSKKTENNKPILWQTCHILHKRGRYYICHFKQLFLLDGRTRVTEFSEDDEDRLLAIAKMLDEWGLVTTLDDIESVPTNIMVIPYRDKGKWTLKEKYTIGDKQNG